MTDHVRTQIRLATVTALQAITGLSSIGSHVFPTRRMPLQPEHFPAILVYTTTEESSAETLSGPRSLSRNLDLVIEGVAQDTSTIDATLDAIAVAIETAMGAAFADPTSPLRQLLRAGTLVNTQIGFTKGSTQDEAGTGHVILTYRVNYRTRSENPTLIN